MTKHNSIWLVVVALIAAGFFWLAPRAAERDAVFRTYAPLVEVDSLVHQRFVEHIDDSSLVDGAIHGMMLQLDRYSGYIGPEELPGYQKRASGEYIGIGVRLGSMGPGSPGPTVIAPTEQSPAEEAGIRPGDVILAIDGDSTEGMGVADVDRRLEGDPGTIVELLVRHDTGDTETISVIRSPIPLQSVKGFALDESGNWNYVLDPEAGIAYIRISSFHEHTLQQFDEAIAAVRNTGAKALVLDLRFNGGGSMRAAVGLVDRFVASGVIVSTVTRQEAVDTYRATAEGTLPNWPLAVLVNGASASASEIVAGSLQDNARAVVVGTRSFGKGVVQNVVPLRSHPAAVSLTVAHYRLPSGRIIHKTPAAAAKAQWGVLPDRVVELDRIAMRAIQDRRYQLDTQRAATAMPPLSPSALSTALAETSVLMDEQLTAAVDAVREKLASAASR